ncbi:MAG: hypothetical protein GTO67_14450 [Gammaproteobacteria bacterium]|nr:hypothetical protein [Gammaproteobacteria bacterium]NIM74973.1 hypothetical protein [Gammaproteobacteria bacterium]NIN39762.1 hypothetical protein [Gammaproteobacteria bacterium]NIO26890.1 hypothetical protein [Gammaproteobacteria bacterium]NIO67446.1 hypothetical protein [Gammaproteobacteria bacterium]
MASTIPYQGDAAEGAESRQQPEAKQVPRSGFMVSPVYDGILFIGAPLIGLVFALAMLGGLPWVMRPATMFGSNEALISIFIGVWTYAHLCAVVFRSHLNRDIYSRFKLRFTVVPLALFVGMLLSDWLLVTAVIIAVFWDVYHTAMQNFGFCRIYDSRQGSFSEKGRKLDIMVNHLLYVGPIVGGLSFAPTLNALDQYADVGWYFPIELADFLVFLQPRLTLLFLIGGSLFLAYYVYSYWQLSQEGYRVSRQKVTILFSTGITSVWAWGFLPPFYAFFVSNFYHALQYFGIVWAIENRNIRRTIGLSNLSSGAWITFAVFLLSLVAAGIAFKVYGTGTIRWSLGIFTVISLMHFWYDSFVWQAHKIAAA